MKKLHIGVGGNYLTHHGRNPCIHDGWVETDKSPRGSHVLKMDATQRFPFEDGTFDYVFNEHMIEHIVYTDGLKMLTECHRVLKPGGKVRISTPDLVWMLHLLQDELSDLEKAYIARMHTHEPASIPRPTPAFVVNYMVRMGGENGGHVFIYDEETLTHALTSVGFSVIERFKIMESNDEHLRGLEAEGRLPPGMLQLETFTLEGTK